MRDYFTEVRLFDYAEAAHASLAGTLAAANACVECCDRHAASGRAALVWEGQDGQVRRYRFDELQAQAARFANLLAERGVGPGDRVAGLLPRIPELLACILGTWRLGAVYQPLFTAFGPKAIEHRLKAAGTRVVVTDAANRAKLDGLLPSEAILTVGENLAADLARQPATCEPVLLGLEAPFLMMFTSGTTGLAKPLYVPLKAIVAFKTYMRDAVGLDGTSRFWNLADPGWAYGLYYAITGPLALGYTTLLYEGAFNVESTCRLIRDHRITHLAGSPTAYRLLMARREEVEPYLAGQLVAVSSAGEPLTPEVIRWFAKGMGCTIHDHYGQTELGMVLCNHHALAHPVRIGAAGFAMPGHCLAVLDEQLNEVPVDTLGTLALDRERSPLMWFAGYAGQPTAAFAGRYYLTGDTVERHADGSISFVGRADDVITTSGYRVGPFDVESALVEHPSVVEAAVIGKPDPERTEIIKAFVVLKPNVEPSEALVQALTQHVRCRLSAHAYPREIAFVAELPKTPSGKIQRFVLRHEELARATAAVPQS